MGILKGLLGGKTIEKSLDLADQYIEDKDVKNKLMTDVIMKQLDLDAQKTNPILDGIHKLGRQIISIGIAYLWYDAKKNGIELPLTELLMIVAPGTAYIVAKGRGN